jgi:uncharacterized lipoprotein YmbA
MMKRLLVLVLLTGCAIFSRTKNSFYSLETIGPDTPTRATVSGAPIAIDGIELPPGIDRREIVVRNGNEQLDIRGTQVWAGPLEDMVIHTLAFDLAKRLPNGAVVLPGAVKPATARPMVIVFEDLAARADRTFVLDARLTTGTTTRHERITVPLQSLDSAKIVAGMSDALSELADRIVAGM